jgi:regulator of PEP synthase PpsR (kinase-PPPase family)
MKLQITKMLMATKMRMNINTLGKSIEEIASSIRNEIGSERSSIRDEQRPVWENE